MKKAAFVFVMSVLLSSCATLVNQPFTHITIYTTEPSVIVLNHDTISTKKNKASFSVERKNEAITIVALTDSLTKRIDVEPKKSLTYWGNIACSYGIGMLVDRNSPKRFSYPEKIYINSADTINRFSTYGRANNKGELRLHVSLPHINSFQLTPKDERTKINTGFWGFTLGLDYYHSKSQFLNFSASGVMDFWVPVPGAVDMSGEYELMSSRYFSLSNNHKLGRFAVGYGLSFASNTWDFRYYDSFDPPPPTRDPIMRSHFSFGLIFPAYYQLGEIFNIGVVYRPTFFRPDLPDQFKYEHLISIDFAWKIRLKK